MVRGAKMGHRRRAKAATGRSPEKGVYGLGPAKVQRGELRQQHAVRIGHQIMRDNALALFPKLRRRL